jgi:hypothetical protein
MRVTRLFSRAGSAKAKRALDPGPGVQARCAKDLRNLVAQIREANVKTAEQVASIAAHVVHIQLRGPLAGWIGGYVLDYSERRRRKVKKVVRF